jgi:23S rRNA (uracil1939-C5)-methyltransferase
MKKQYTVAPVIKNEKMTVTFEDLTSEGMGVAKVEGYPLFVADGLPGERATIKVTKVGKSFGFARIEERLSSSPDRIPTRDVKGTRVGTMPLQNSALLCPIGIQTEQRRTSDETHRQNA